MLNDHSRVSELLQAAIASFDEDMVGFPLPRVLPIAICVDAENQSREIGVDIAREVRAVLEKFGYRETYEWGPFQASNFTTIFGTGSELEDGRTFREKTEEVTKEVLDRLRRLPWDKWAKRTGNVIKIAVAVGEVVLIFLPQAGVWVQVALKISPKVWLLLKAAGKAVVIVEAAKKLFFENDQLLRALKDGPTEPDVRTGRDIQVGRPIRFDPAKIGKNPRGPGKAY